MSIIPSSIKDKTFDKLVSYYEETGDVKKVVSVCREIVKSPESNGIIRGETAEIVLYVMLLDFIKRNNLTDWRICKGLILKDVDCYDGKYFTEVDLTVFTPKCIFSFECKSYKGPKYLIDKGTLYSKKGGKFTKALDVYDQHVKHFNTLFKNIESGLNKGISNPRYKSFKLLYFDFADVPTEDRRDKQFKAVFPIINYKNLYKLFVDYWDRPDYWNMNSVNRMVDIIEKTGEKNQKRHLSYVTGLRSSRDISHKN